MNEEMLELVGVSLQRGQALLEPEMERDSPLLGHGSDFFFFSSRRRHTSSLCDWSSDVCSSDHATSSSDEKLARATELGADATVNHATGDVVAFTREVTGGGAHVVVDDVGEATWKRTLDAARPEGRIVVCGATTGPNPPAALHRVWWKQLSILGSTMGTPDDFQGVWELVAAGKARPTVDRVFPLANARAAHERLEAGEQLGKIVLSIPS